MLTPFLPNLFDGLDSLQPALGRFNLVHGRQCKLLAFSFLGVARDFGDVTVPGYGNDFIRCGTRFRETSGGSFAYSLGAAIEGGDRRSRSQQCIKERYTKTGLKSRFATERLLQITLENFWTLIAAIRCNNAKTSLHVIE